MDLSEKLILNGENDGVFEFILNKLPELKNKIEKENVDRENGEVDSKSLKDYGYIDLEVNESIPKPPFSQLSKTEKENFLNRLPDFYLNKLKKDLGKIRNKRF